MSERSGVRCVSQRPPSALLAFGLVVAVAVSALPASAQQWVMPRTPWGHPDLQGNWSNITLTPFERAAGMGPVYTPEEVARIEGRERARVEAGRAPSDPERPPLEPGPVGGYNDVYFERGDGVARVNGEPRSSLITFPADGRMPELSPEGMRRQADFQRFRATFGAYDHPELRPLAERCIVYYGSSNTGVMGSPMTPTRAYNNNYTVVQNEDHVLIRSEMIHDIRIIRLGEPERLPPHIRPWFGDSWGHWEGDTLVVETTNIHLDQGIFDSPQKILHSEDLRVIERFVRVDEDTILYSFEMHDPATYTEPWGGEIPWDRLDEPIYEYACHEGNYALSNILSGARFQERESGRDGR